MKCLSPNYVRFMPDPTDYEKKKVIFVKSGKRDFTDDQYKQVIEGSIEVPCGQCVVCLLDYSRVWANRCYLESLCHPFNWFITLTYDDAHLVYGKKGFPTIEKDAISSFIRKLRDKLGHKITCRYFGCLEYGETTMRPHAHIIVFGPPLTDLTIDMPDMSKPMVNGKYPIFRRKNSYGDFVFFSQTIYDCWKKGKVEIEECSWNTSAYVSRYVMKKQKGIGKEIYERLGIEPEILRMSNRPGIGAEWLLANKEKLLHFDYLSVINNKGVQTTRPPRYFEKLMMKDPESREFALMEANKLGRILNAKKRFVDPLTTKSVGQKALDESDFIIKKSKLLKRDLT